MKKNKWLGASIFLALLVAWGVLYFRSGENVIEIFVLRCYMRFSAGMKEQFLDDGWRFGRIIDNMYEAPLEEKLQIERKELDAIIAVYEKENEKLTVFFN